MHLVQVFYFLFHSGKVVSVVSTYVNQFSENYVEIEKIPPVVN